MLGDLWPILISAAIGGLVAFLIATRLCLSKKGHLTLIGIVLFAGLYVGFDRLLPLGSAGDEITPATESTEPDGMADQKPVPFDLGLRSLGLDMTTFRTRFNSAIAARFPEEKSVLSLPLLVIETGVIRDAFRHRVDDHITIAAGLQKQSGQIDEITMIATKDFPAEDIRRVQRLAIATVIAVIGESDFVDSEISVLFIDATSNPGTLALRRIDDIRLTAMLDSMAGMTFTLSRPVDLPPGPAFDETLWRESENLPAN